MHISQLFLSLCAVLGANAAAVIGSTSPSSSSPAPRYAQRGCSRPPLKWSDRIACGRHRPFPPNYVMDTEGRLFPRVKVPENETEREDATQTHPYRLAPRAESPMNCKGSAGCQQLWKACPEAEKLIKDDEVYRTGGPARDTGVWKRTGKLDFWGCGIFIQKKKHGGHEGSCEIMGKEMREKVQALRAYGCKICGNYDLGNGCVLKINYTIG